MNKNKLIQAHPELKLYDASNIIEMRNYKANLKHHQNEGNTTDHLKIIAPFGSDCFNADFYYFTSEDTPISEVILKQMGFNDDHLWIGNFYIKIDDFEVTLNHPSKSKLYCNIETANQLYTLIELLK